MPLYSNLEKKANILFEQVATLCVCNYYYRLLFTNVVNIRALAAAAGSSGSCALANRKPVALTSLRVDKFNWEPSWRPEGGLLYIFASNI